MTEESRYPQDFKSPLAFVMVLEAGKLEKQVMLLVESIRRFAGKYKDSSIWAVQPRKSPLPAAETLDFLQRYEVYFLRANINTASPGADESNQKLFGLLNKPYAAAFLEAQLSGQVETLVLLDSDTLILQSPEEMVLKNGEVVAVRPVDRRNVGSLADQPINAYWRKLYEICQVDPNCVWTVETSLDQAIIRAYFNSGHIAVRPEHGLFRKWRANVEQFIQFRNDPGICATEEEYFFMEQVSFSATVLGNTTREEVGLFSNAYNYPLHKQRYLPEKYRLASFSEISTIHYHQAFYKTTWWRHIEVPRSYKAWLAPKLPLVSPEQTQKTSWLHRMALKLKNGR